MAKSAAPLPAETRAAPTGTACRIVAAEADVFACGQRHQSWPIDYPDGWFSAQQLDELAAHPLLKVERR